MRQSWMVAVLVWPALPGPADGRKAGKRSRAQLATRLWRAEMDVGAKVSRCDTGKADVGVPGLRRVSGEGSCVKRGMRSVKLPKGKCHVEFKNLVHWIEIHI